MHTLLRSTAAHLAVRDWHKVGARNESEALGYYLTRLRRRWASVAVGDTVRVLLYRRCLWVRAVTLVIRLALAGLLPTTTVRSGCPLWSDRAVCCLPGSASGAAART